MDINEQSKKIGDNIRAARKAAKFNQEEIAEQLGKAQATVSDWEAGKHLPSLIDVVIMCEYYSVTPNQIFGVLDDGDTPSPPTPSIIGPCIASSSGKIIKITPEDEAYLKDCLLEARDGQQNTSVLTSKAKKETSA